MPVPLGSQHTPPALLQQLAQTLIAQLQQVQNQLQTLPTCDSVTTQEANEAASSVQAAISYLNAYARDITRCQGSFPGGGVVGGMGGAGGLTGGGGGLLGGLGGPPNPFHGHGGMGG